MADHRPFVLSQFDLQQHIGITSRILKSEIVPLHSPEQPRYQEVVLITSEPWLVMALWRFVAN
jgi:hypothetical protein